MRTLNPIKPERHNRKKICACVCLLRNSMSDTSCFTSATGFREERLGTKVYGSGFVFKVDMCTHPLSARAHWPFGPPQQKNLDRIRV